MEVLTIEKEQSRINIVNKINILIDKINNLELNDNLTKIQKNYIIMLENTIIFLLDIKKQINIYQDFNTLHKYIKNKDDEIDEFIINVKRFNSYT